MPDHGDMSCAYHSPIIPASHAILIKDQGGMMIQLFSKLDIQVLQPWSIIMLPVRLTHPMAPRKRYSGQSSVESSSSSVEWSTAGIVRTIIEEIRTSRIFENPTFADLRLARDSHPQRQAGGTSMAGWQGEQWQEKDPITIDTEEETREEEIDELLAARAPHATGGNVGGSYPVQTDVWRRSSEVGIHAAEEAPRRRLYEAPERCAAVFQMKTKEEGVSATRLNNKGKEVSVVHLHLGSTRGAADVPITEDAINCKDDPQTLEKHSAFQLVSIPSDVEIQIAKQRVQYQEGLFHFAMTGVSGAGKSSLINAFRGLRNRDQEAAPTGVVETTTDIMVSP
ncbi:hypothetical protein F4604DRAFT_1953327 [Suillus subluteus]|nr:hypothetical protein F4604DRAFT_1953327 [Suillus subluteus]